LGMTMSSSSVVLHARGLCSRISSLPEFIIHYESATWIEIVFSGAEQISFFYHTK
jgi:hypothetical protein